jgi:hypothetical protein
MLRDPLDFLRDIEEGCNRITEYSTGLSRDEVFGDKMRLLISSPLWLRQKTSFEASHLLNRASVRSE